MNILRFTTAGNVDDGKSTLIGRLLHDTNSLSKDVIQSISHGHTQNLAFIADGLRIERELGITIDIAYKYFTTKKRKYIISDAPGHFEFTRNLITGASNVNLIIILIDAVNGITEQTRRHLFVTSFLKIRNVVIAINKMDMCDFQENVFNSIKKEASATFHKVELPEPAFIPISALLGDNIFKRSSNMPWYKDGTLMDYLENCIVEPDNNSMFRFSIQYKLTEQKGYAGKIISGMIKCNDIVCVYPYMKMVHVKRIFRGFNEVDSARFENNVIIEFEPDNNFQRGDLVADVNCSIIYSNSIWGYLCWLDSAYPLQLSIPYILRLHTLEVSCEVRDIAYKIDINTFEPKAEMDTLILANDFARINIITKHEISYDLSVPECSRGIIIDPLTGNTSGVFIFN